MANDMLDNPLTPATINLGAHLIPMAAVHAGHALENALVSDKERRTKWKHKLKKEIELPKDIKLKVDPKMFGLGAYYMPEDREIHIGPRSSPGVVAHEMGHASGTDKLIKVERALRYPALALSLLSLGAALSLPEASKINKALMYGSAAMEVPGLLEEARASIRGYKAMSKAMGRKAALRGLISTVPAFSTYLAPVAAPLVINKLITT